MEISNFRKLYIESKIVWSNHGLERMQERNISINDIEFCINNGEIIEEYNETQPAISSALIYCKVKDKAIHIVLGIDANTLYFITAYYPTLDIFESDLKTRRKK